MYEPLDAGVGVGRALNQRPQPVELPCYGITIDDDKITSRLYSDDMDAIYEATELAMIHAIEELVLAHYQAGVDVLSPKYVEGIQVAVDACLTNTPQL